MIHAAGTAGRLSVLRLLPGEDVRIALAAWAVDNAIDAAAIGSAVGSLSRAEIRYAGLSAGTTITGDLEICSLSGTLSKHGLHVHITVADAQGRTTGGHLLQGCTVRTTLELVVQEIDGVEFLRTRDPATGFDELDPRAKA